MFLENYPDDPDSLLVLDKHSLSRLREQGGRWSTQLIAGSKTPGNRDGAGQNAGFMNPSAVRAMNKTTVLVSDTGNHCLRMVDLTTGYSSQYAGRCGRKGTMSHGYELVVQLGRLNGPVGLWKNSKGVYVCNKFDNSLILMSNGKMKQIVASNEGPKWFKSPTHITGIEHMLYISFKNGLASFDTNRGELRMLAGRSRPGDEEGKFSESSFNQPSSIVPLTDDILLMADTMNSRALVISLNERKVAALCTGGIGTHDGRNHYCRLDFPHSLVVFKSRILIGRSGGQMHELVNNYLQTQMLPTKPSPTQPTTLALVLTQQPGLIPYMHLLPSPV